MRTLPGIKSTNLIIPWQRMKWYHIYISLLRLTYTRFYFLFLIRNNEIEFSQLYAVLVTQSNKFIIYLSAILLFFSLNQHSSLITNVIFGFNSVFLIKCSYIFKLFLLESTIKFETNPWKCWFSTRFSYSFAFKLNPFFAQHLPNKESNPQASHIQKLIPTEPVLTSKPDGDTNIPDPNRRHKREIMFIASENVSFWKFKFIMYQTNCIFLEKQNNIISTWLFLDIYFGRDYENNWWENSIFKHQIESVKDAIINYK